MSLIFITISTVAIRLFDYLPFADQTVSISIEL